MPIKLNCKVFTFLFPCFVSHHNELDFKNRQHSFIGTVVKNLIFQNLLSLDSLGLLQTLESHSLREKNIILYLYIVSSCKYIRSYATLWSSVWFLHSTPPPRHHPQIPKLLLPCFSCCLFLQAQHRRWRNLETA